MRKILSSLFRILTTGLVILVFYSCSSRTKVAENNKRAQAIFTSGQSFLNPEPLANVQIQLTGRVLLAKQCTQSATAYIIQVHSKSGVRPLYTSTVPVNLEYVFDFGVPQEGNYDLNLLDARTGKTIDSQKMTALKSQDRISLNFNGCM